MKIKSLESTNRLPIEGLAILFFKALYRWGKALWAIFIIVFLKLEKHPEIIYYLYLSIGIILLLCITHTILSYKNFSFQVKDDSFIVKKGYLNKETKSVPLERIQTVNIKQNIIQQILGIVQLDIDSAGSKEKEISLPAVRFKQAKELENILLSKKNAISIDGDNKKQETSTEGKFLLSLSIKDLIKIAISDNIFKAGLLALSFIYGIYNQYKEILEERFSKEIEDIGNSLTTVDWNKITILLFSFFIISIVISIIRNVLINYNLKLSLSSEGYKIEKGLFNKKYTILPIKKIQTYTWVRIL